MKFWRQITTIVWKDIISEIRTRESIFSVLVFTLLVIVIFNFAFSSNHETMKIVAPGILWVTFAFAGVLSLNRAFVMEKEGGCIEGLLACPISREAIYIGKMLGSLIFMLIVEAIALPVFTLLFNLPVLSPEVVITTLLATVGFVAIGTTFAAMAVNTRAREMVLPILFLPMVSPIIVSAVEASGLAISGETWGSMTTWLEIIIAFDVIFIVASYLVFAFVVEE
ncbi:heme exporter protein CcmB [Chloroflexota bacterium]